MSRRKKERIKVDRKNEQRKEGISRMIDEGGMGADKYYDIEKAQSKPSKKEDDNQ